MVASVICFLVVGGRVYALPVWVGCSCLSMTQSWSIGSGFMLFWRLEVHGMGFSGRRRCLNDPGLMFSDIVKVAGMRAAAGFLEAGARDIRLARLSRCFHMMSLIGGIAASRGEWFCWWRRSNL